MNIFRKLGRDESGATAIAYGLIAALVSVAILTVLSMLSDRPSATVASKTVAGELDGSGRAEEGN